MKDENKKCDHISNYKIVHEPGRTLALSATIYYKTNPLPVVRLEAATQAELDSRVEASIEWHQGTHRSPFEWMAAQRNRNRRLGKKNSNLAFGKRRIKKAFARSSSRGIKDMNKESF